MAEVQNLRKVVDLLQRSTARISTANKVVVAVGYTQSYAIYVHENVEMKLRGKPRRKPAKGVYWGPRGQAKFLEQPARELSNSGEVARIIMAALEQRKTLAQALLLAGLRIQRESMGKVPIDTGALRASAFTRIEQGKV